MHSFSSLLDLRIQNPLIGKECQRRVPYSFFHKNYHDYSRRASTTNHLSYAVKFPIRCHCPGFISQALRLSHADPFRICHAHPVTSSLPLVMLRLLLRKLLRPHPLRCSNNEFLIGRKHRKISTQDMCFPSSGIWVLPVVEWIRKECGVVAVCTSGIRITC